MGASSDLQLVAVTDSTVRAGCSGCGVEISLPRDAALIDQMSVFVLEHLPCVFEGLTLAECRVCGATFSAHEVAVRHGRFFAVCRVCRTDREVTLQLPTSTESRTADFPVGLETLARWLAKQQVDGWAWDGEAPREITLNGAAFLRHRFLRSAHDQL